MSERLRGSYGASPPELRLVLLGNIGCGKTSSADTILGQLSHASPSASRSCQLRQGVPDGRNVTLVEAPRWYWAGGKMDDSVRKETERAMMLLAPGPHAFLLLVPVSQFTEVGCPSSFALVLIIICSCNYTIIFLVPFLFSKNYTSPNISPKMKFHSMFSDGGWRSCRAGGGVWGGGAGSHPGPADLWGLFDGKKSGGI